MAAPVSLLYFSDKERRYHLQAHGVLSWCWYAFSFMVISQLYTIIPSFDSQFFFPLFHWNPAKKIETVTKEFRRHKAPDMSSMGKQVKNKYTKWQATLENAHNIGNKWQWQWNSKIMLSWVKKLYATNGNRKPIRGQGAFSLQSIEMWKNMPRWVW